MTRATHRAPSQSCGQRVRLQRPVPFRTKLGKNFHLQPSDLQGSWGSGSGLFPGRANLKACRDLSGNQTCPKGQSMSSGQREDVTENKDTGVILT